MQSCGKTSVREETPIYSYNPTNNPFKYFPYVTHCHVLMLSKPYAQYLAAQQQVAPSEKHALRPTRDTALHASRLLLTYHFGMQSCGFTT